MRTGLFLLAGFLLLGAITIVTRLFHENIPSAPAWGTVAFLAIWLGVTGFNMWIGVTKAGYSVGEEIPILLLLFGVPAVAALIVNWKWS